MQERKLCEGCGTDDLEGMPAFAGEVAFEMVETWVWRCGGCGGESELVEAVIVEIDDLRSARAAA